MLTDIYSGEVRNDLFMFLSGIYFSYFYVFIENRFSKFFLTYIIKNDLINKINILVYPYIP